MVTDRDRIEPLILGPPHFRGMRRGAENAGKIPPPIQITFPHHIEHGQKHGQNGGSKQEMRRGGVEVVEKLGCGGRI